MTRKHFEVVIITVLFLVALLALPPRAHAAMFDDWDTGDIILGTAFASACVIDWGQTRTIADHGPGENLYYYEDDEPYGEYGFLKEVGFAKNFIGSNPTRKEVDTYFATALVVNFLIADMIGPKYRKAYLLLANLIQWDTVNHNYKVGIRTTF